MKTERRHELQTNELAHTLARGIERVKPYSSALTLALVIVVVVIAASTIIARQARQGSAEGWAAYFSAEQRDFLSDSDSAQDRLRDVAEDFSGSKVADFARLAAADEGFRRGAGLLMEDKRAAYKHLNAAAADYRSLKREAEISIVRDRATFNLAVTLEALGQLEDAQTEYKAVGGALKEMAQHRAEKIAKSDDVRAFYDWYRNAEPALTALPPGSPGTPGKRPDFDVDDPTTSPASLPSKIDDPIPPLGDEGDTKLPPLFNQDPAPSDASPNAPPDDAPPDDGDPPNSAPSSSTTPPVQDPPAADPDTPPAQN